MSRNTPHAASNNMILGGGDTGTFVAGDRLKQVDTPVETLLGAANGAVSGAMVSTAVSAAVTLGKEGNQNLIQNVFRNVTGAHLLGVLGGTAAFAALGGIVRFSRARLHNQWSENHYQFLNRGQATYTARLDAEKEADTKDVGPSR